MSTPPAPGTTGLSLEQKIMLAAQQSEQIANIFSPAVGQAIEAGVAVEPIIKGLIGLFAGLFHHHVKSKS